MVRGLVYAQCSFTGHGERGRMLTGAIINGEARFFCGCFQGPAAELHAYIQRGHEAHRQSRTDAFRFVWTQITDPRHAKKEQA